MTSDRQAQIYENLICWWQAWGYPPTVQELADAMGVVKSVAYSHLLALREQGLITWTWRAARTFRPIIM